MRKMKKGMQELEKRNLVYPQYLEEFVEFYENLSDKKFSQGCSFVDDGYEMLLTYSQDEKFLNRFLTFGHANFSGSVYSFFIPEDSVEYPVVIFGDEGGVKVVARNFAEFLRLLAVDSEPIVDFDNVYGGFFNEEPSASIEEFRTWLSEQNIKLIEYNNNDEIIEILNRVKEMYQKEIDDLISKYE